MEKRLRRLGPFDCTVWIDGSVLDGDPPWYPPPSAFDPRRDGRHFPWMKRHADRTKWGGSGLYIVFEPSVTDSIRDSAALNLAASGSQFTASRSLPAGKHTHSFRAEQVAMHAALTLLHRHLTHTTEQHHVVVLSDSRSFLTTLSAGPHIQDQPLPIQCWQLLARLVAKGYRVTLQFVYAHCGLDGNDKADELAKSAALELSQSTAAGQPPPYPLTVSDAICRYKTFLRLDSRERAAMTAFDRAESHDDYSSFVRIVAGRPIPRRRHLTTWAERQIRQLRTGHHALIRSIYSPDWHTLGNVQRRMRYLPCPICSAPTLFSPLLHLFYNCTDSTTRPLRVAWLREVERREKKHPGLPVDSLWYVLFAHPELGLEYLQKAGVLPQYAVLVESGPDDGDDDNPAPASFSDTEASSDTPHSEPDEQEYGLVPIL